MKQVVLISVILGLSLGLFNSCNRRSDQAEAKSRLEKLVEIQKTVLNQEQAFISVLDSVNNLRDVVNEYHDSIHALAIRNLSVAYDGYVQALYDALGKTAALANSGTDMATDAMSSYLLSMRGVAENRYSEMVKLTSLRLDKYGDEEFSQYTKLLQDATTERQRLEDELQSALNTYSKEFEIELRSVTPSVE